jgi:hypothetical protein
MNNVTEELKKDLDEKKSALQELALLEMCGDQVAAFVAVNALQEMVVIFAEKLNMTPTEVKNMQSDIIDKMKQKHEDRAVGVRKSLARRGVSESAIQVACANPYIVKNTLLLEFLNSTAG